MSQLALTGMEAGHPSVAAALEGFCERWDMGVASLFVITSGLAERLGIGAGSVWEQDQYLKGTFKVLVNAGIGNPHASNDEIEKKSLEAVLADHAFKRETPEQARQAREDFDRTWADTKKGLLNEGLVGGMLEEVAEAQGMDRETLDRVRNPQGVDQQGGGQDSDQSGDQGAAPDERRQLAGEGRGPHGRRGRVARRQDGRRAGGGRLAGGANAVRNTANSAANRLGADVGEVELGQSEDPKQLVHGSASSLRTTAGHLKDFHAAFTRTGEGLKKLGTDGIKGAAADAFRDSVQEKAPRWFAAAAAFETAAGAVGRFADTVTWAQGQAKEAIDEYKAAVKLSENAHAAYDRWVKDYESAVKAQQDPLPARPMGFTDPGTDGIKAARQKLAEARRQRDDVAHSVAQALEKARDAAPKVSAADAALVEIVRKGAEVEHFVGGIAKGTAGLVNFARGLDAHDPYNMNHPTVAQMGLNSMSAGFLTTANDPGAAAKAMLDQAMKDPYEFGGTLVPEAIGPKGGGLLAGTTRRATTAAKLLDDAKHLDGNKQGGSRGDHEKDPNHNSNQCGDNVCDGDPVDMATGRVLLPQTDIALPGSLPLVFRRTFDSSHRSGRWFGPAWSSTVDQRLEIDTEGVVFSCDEGSLLAYPHPAPGVPVMPTHGRQWPLDRVEDGYTLTDPDTGRVWHFVDHSDELALLAQIDDRNGRWISFEHDEAGAPTSIIHHGGYHLKLTTSEGRVTALHLAGAAADGSDQEVLRYGYTVGHLTEVTNSSGRPLSFDCDEHGRITAWTDTNGSRYDYVYDDQDRCVYQSGINGHVESRFTWDDRDPATGLRTTMITDGLGHTKRFVVDERSHVVAEIDALGAVTRFDYDRHNRLLSRTDPLGHSSRFTYGEHGRISVMERPDGRQARFEYDDNRMPIRIVGADGNVTRQTFDARGNRTSVTTPSGATTQFAYDAAGRLTSMTDPLGATTRLVLDPRGLPSRSPIRRVPRPDTNTTPSDGGSRSPTPSAHRRVWSGRSRAGPPGAPHPTAPWSPGRTTARATASPTPTPWAARPTSRTRTSTC